MECGKIVLGGLGGERMGRSGWKGKGKAGDQDGVGDDEGEEDYAIILPHSFPGLFFSFLLLSLPLTSPITQNKKD